MRLKLQTRTTLVYAFSSRGVPSQQPLGKREAWSATSTFCPYCEKSPVSSWGGLPFWVLILDGRFPGGPYNEDTMWGPSSPAVGQPLCLLAPTIPGGNRGEMVFSSVLHFKFHCKMFRIL